MDAAGDLNAWLGKPPEKASSEAVSEDEVVPAQSSAGSASPSVSSDQSADVVEIPHRPLSQWTAVQPKTSFASVVQVEIEEEKSGELQDEALLSQEEVQFVVNQQVGLTVEVPELSEDEKDEFEHLPGHFNVKRILYATGDADRRFVVKLGSGEVDLVSSHCA